MLLSSFVHQLVILQILTRIDETKIQPINVQYLYASLETLFINQSMYNAWWYIKTSIVHWLVRNLVTLMNIFPKIFCFCNQSMYNACSPFWDKICTLIGYIRKKISFWNITNQCTMLLCIYRQALYIDWWYHSRYCTLIGYIRTFFEM